LIVSGPALVARSHASLERLARECVRDGERILHLSLSTRASAAAQDVKTLQARPCRRSPKHARASMLSRIERDQAREHF